MRQLTDDPLQPNPTLFKELQRDFELKSKQAITQDDLIGSGKKLSGLGNLYTSLVRIRDIVPLSFTADLESHRNGSPRT